MGIMANTGIRIVDRYSPNFQTDVNSNFASIWDEANLTQIGNPVWCDPSLNHTATGQSLQHFTRIYGIYGSGTRRDGTGDNLPTDHVIKMFILDSNEVPITGL